MSAAGGIEGNALILMYHRVTRVGADPFSLCVTPHHFQEQLEILRTCTRPLALSELAGALRAGTLPRRAVAVTFDDGYLDNLENARSALERAGVPATVFVTTGPLEQDFEFWWDELERIFIEPGRLPSHLQLEIDGHGHRWDLDGVMEYGEDDYRRYGGWRAGDTAPTARHSIYFSIWQLLQRLSHDARRTVLDQIGAWAGLPNKRRVEYLTVSPKELQTLAQGKLIEIGAHTVSHPVLPDLPMEAQEHEIRQSQLRLEQILGRRVSSFAYPYGMLTDDTVALVRIWGSIARAPLFRQP